MSLVLVLFPPATLVAMTIMPRSPRNVQRTVVGVLLITELTADEIDSRDVDGVGVGIGTSDHTTICFSGGLCGGHCRDGTALRVESGGRRRSSGRQDIDEALAKLLSGHVRPTGER